MSSDLRADPGEIHRALDLLIPADQVTELRALQVPEGRGFEKTYSGYFDDRDKLVEEAVKLSDRGAKGVYVTLNPVDPALLARANNRAKKAQKGSSTGDDHIVRRRWLAIDGDPVRPSGISSTDAEHESAVTRIREVRDYLREQGWPEGVLADSGNGGHLLFRIDIDRDDNGLVERCLEALALKFSDDKVSVDTCVHNPARIWKLYGTVARKGDPTPDRPHRIARLLEVPDVLG